MWSLKSPDQDKHVATSRMKFLPRKYIMFDSILLY